MAGKQIIFKQISRRRSPLNICQSLVTVRLARFQPVVFPPSKKTILKDIERKSTKNKENQIVDKLLITSDLFKILMD